jgi:hypothetical protein
MPAKGLKDGTAASREFSWLIPKLNSGRGSQLLGESHATADNAALRSASIVKTSLAGLGLLKK